MLKLIFIFLISLVCFNASAHQKKLIINNTILQSHQTPQAINTQAMLVEAFDALGIDIEFRYRPYKRSIEEVNNGVADGDVARISSITQGYSNVVLVPESIANIDIIAFTTTPGIDLMGYKVDQHRYHVGYLLGWKKIENFLQVYERKSAVGDHHTLFKLLVKKRFDVVLFSQVAGENILASQNIVNYQTSPSLLTYPVYLILNKKHTNLIAKLAAQLKIMKKKYSGNFKHTYYCIFSCIAIT